ncbi:MAG TPA: hypothetical protein VIF83_02535 [Gemmatimonadaceae bacterium]
MPFNKFFVSWSESFSSSPIQTQQFALDARQNRQFAPFAATEEVLAFARANPGRIYFDGDEPDQWCIAAGDYAVMYHDFVGAIRSADPTAGVSPAGFAEPNVHCCPEDDEQCMVQRHSISYAEQFYNAYVQRYGVAPTVTEWRFHDFGLKLPEGDIEAWWSRVDRLASWSVAHGANMVLGVWGFTGWHEAEASFQEHLKQAMGRLMNDPRINEAIYWSHEHLINSVRPLVNPDGSLTAEGRTFANPLTDIPTRVTVAGSANGSATLQWDNTTWAWPIEAEFWVKARGSNSFVYKFTTRDAGPGAAQTSFDRFEPGDSVNARVRYYNRFDQAAWSSFSNTALIPLPEAPKKSASRKTSRFCFLPIGIRSQSCD